LLNITHMVSKLREEWINDPQLKHWASIECIQDSKCGCSDDSQLVELCEHDSCIRGRIDTIVCTECNRVKSFKIIR
jgi:hypothetical protein